MTGPAGGDRRAGGAAPEARFGPRIPAGESGCSKFSARQLRWATPGLEFTRFRSDDGGVSKGSFPRAIRGENVNDFRYVAKNLRP